MLTNTHISLTDDTAVATAPQGSSTKSAVLVARKYSRRPTITEAKKRQSKGQKTRKRAGLKKRKQRKFQSALLPVLFESKAKSNKVTQNKSDLSGSEKWRCARSTAWSN